MESWMEWLSIAGAIASIGGAVWALLQARRASRSATAAETVRDQLVDRRKIVEVSRVHHETDRILKTVSRVGPSCNASLLRGVDCSEIAKEVEEYGRFLNQQRAHFSDEVENRASDLCTELEQDIETLSEARTFEDKKAAGKRIYFKINDFLPVAKQLSDEARERVDIGT